MHELLVLAVNEVSFQTLAVKHTARSCIALYTSMQGVFLFVLGMPQTQYAKDGATKG